MVLEQFIIDADIIWDQVGKAFFENPEAKPGRIMRVQVVNAGIIEDLTGYTLNLGWTSVRDPSKFGLDAFDDVDTTKGIFEIEYTSGMLTNIGPLNASLQLVPPGQGRQIESNNFKLTVKNSAINPEAIQGETSFKALENALVEVIGWNARIDVVEQDFKDRADALDGAYPVRLTAAEQSVAAVEAQVDLLNRGLGETMPTMASLLAAYPTGDTRDHIVAGNIAEVDTLTVTGVPTTAGNVTVTLNGVAVNVPVTIGVAEVASLVVSAVPTVAGNVTVNLNGTAVTVAVDPAVETTTDLVAAKIRATVFTGWTTGGTGSTVTFTATAVGTKTDATYSAGTTGATGTMTTTTQGVAAATTTTVATAIRAAIFAGWTTGGTGAVVTFTATTVGTRTAPVFSGGTTGTTGTFVRTAIGEAANFHRYFWNDAAWVDGRAYQAIESNSEIKDGRLGVDGTLYSDLGGAIRTQISDTKDQIKVAIENGYSMSYVRQALFESGGINSTGVPITDSRYVRTKDFLPSTVTKVAMISGSVYSFMVIKYDLAGVFISRAMALKAYTLDTVGFKYKIVIYHTDNASLLDYKVHYKHIVLAEAAAALPYALKAEVTPAIPNLQSDVADLASGKKFANGAITHLKTNFLRTGKNLLDPSKITYGYYIEFSTGEPFANASYGITAPIEVSEGARIATNHHY